MVKSKYDGLLVFVSVLLSIFAVTAAIFVPIYYSVAGLLAPKTVASVIQNIDYTELLGGATEDAAGENELLSGLITSKTGGKIVAACAERIVGNMLGMTREDEGFNAEFLKGVLNDNFDGILKEMEELTGETVDAESLKAELNGFVEENAEQIAALIPAIAPEEGQTNPLTSVFSVIGTTLRVWFIIAVAAAVALLFGLIYLCRRYNYSGFIWISVDCGIAGVFVTAIAVLLGSPLVGALLESLDGLPVTVAESFVSAAVGKLTVAAVVLWTITAGSIVAVVLLRKYKPMAKAETLQ